MKPATLPAILLVALLSAAPAAAEIHIMDSVEWQCSRAEIIAFGRLTGIDPEKPSEARGKSRHLISLTMQPTAAVKGLPGKAAKAPIHFSVRMPEVDQLLKWKATRTELVVFLRRTIQSYSKDGRTYDLWPLRETGSQVQLLVDPLKQHTALLAASTMARAKTLKDVVAACARAVSGKPPGTQKKPHLLETPFGTEAQKILYSGSSSYLYVPPGVFPKARPSLGQL